MNMKIADLVRLKYNEKKGSFNNSIVASAVNQLNNINKERVDKHGVGVIIEAIPDCDGEVTSVVVYFPRMGNVRSSTQRLELLK